MGHKTALPVTLLLLCSLANADELRPTSNRIDSVTVYLDRAEVTRQIELTIPAGAHTILIPELPAQLFEASLRASGKGPSGMSIATVETRRQFGEQAASEQERKLREQLEGLKHQQSQLNAKQQALDTRAKFIERLASQSGETDDKGKLSLAPEKWAEAWKAIGSGMEETNMARVSLQQEQQSLKQKIDKVEKELRQIQTGRRDTITAAIQIESAKPGKANFELSYQLGDASWSPLYDATLDTEKAEVQLTQSALIRQNSGESWHNAKVTVSTARPSAGAAMPDLYPWWLDFPRPVLKREARSLGLMDKGVLAEAMAPEPEMKMAQVAQAQSVGSEFSVRYAIPGRVTIPADNSKHRFVLSKANQSVTLEARSAPKLDTRAFLYAELDYQGDNPLLPGQWQLQRDGSFVGTHHNDALRPGETIALAFGSDDAINIEYQLIKDERAEEGLLSRENRVARRYSIIASNHHKRKIALTLFDQIPVPRDEDIKVTMAKDSTKPSEENVDDQAGVISWKQSIGANKKWTVLFGYDVAYPKDQVLPGF